MRSSAACCSPFRRCRRPPCRRECAPADCAARPRRRASRAASGLAVAAGDWSSWSSAPTCRPRSSAARSRSGSCPARSARAARRARASARHSPAGARCAADRGGAVLVETKPVRPAPEPAGCRSAEARVDSGLSKFGSAAARGAVRRARRRVGARLARSSLASSSAGRKPLRGRVAGCANACATRARRAAHRPAPET